MELLKICGKIFFEPWVFGKIYQINGISSALSLRSVVGKTNKTAVLPGFLQNRTRQGQRGHNCCRYWYGGLAWLKFSVTPLLLEIPLIWYILPKTHRFEFPPCLGLLYHWRTLWYVYFFYKWLDNDNFLTSNSHWKLSWIFKRKKWYLEGKGL